MSNVLKLIDLKKDFLQAGQKISVIKGVNLEIKKGELVALIGPSGSGKTTLLQIAGLLDSPTSGQVIINDFDAAKSNDAVRTDLRKNHIGFVYQFHHLLPEFSALENTALPLLVQGKKKEEAFELAKKILQEVELEDRLDHKPAQLSGGQQQRVAIARAVVSKPSLILADEPTGNLDSVIADKIFEILHKIARNYQIGCLMVTHNMELAKKADRIVSIKDGMVS